jgi:hypothetical protein
VLVARRVNVGVALELERQRRAHDGHEPYPPDLERRIGQVEAGLAGIVRILARAGLVEVDLVGAVTWTGRGVADAP